MTFCDRCAAPDWPANAQLPPPAAHPPLPSNEIILFTAASTDAAFNSMVTPSVAVIVKDNDVVSCKRVVVLSEALRMPCLAPSNDALSSSHHLVLTALSPTFRRRSS